MDEENLKDSGWSYALFIWSVLIAIRSLILGVFSLLIISPFILLYSLFYPIISERFPRAIEYEAYCLFLAFLSVFIYCYWYFVWKNDRSSSNEG